MGSSTRNIDKKIKKMIQNIGKENIDNNLNEIVLETLRLRKHKSFFYNSEFGDAVLGGVSVLNSIKAGRLPQIKDEIDLLISNNENVLRVQRILESILDALENNGQTITDELILRAFKSTMAKILLDPSLEVEDFVKDFVKAALYLLTLEDTHEANIDEFDFIKIDEIEENFRKITDELVEKYLKSEIYKFVNNDIEFDELREAIVNLKSRIVKDGQ